MNKSRLQRWRYCLAIISILMVLPDVIAQQDPQSEGLMSDFQTLEWTDLMPDEDLQALLNPPDFLNDISDGSDADAIDGRLQSEFNGLGDSRFSQALTSTQVVPEYDGKAIRLPGFIVPLSYNEDQQVTEFFLVPFFGACIHLPPPPPNQIIYANYPQGFDLPSIYDPFWVSGTLSAKLIRNDVATAAYSITVDEFQVYSE